MTLDPRRPSARYYLDVTLATLEVEAKSFGVAASTTRNWYFPVWASLYFSVARALDAVGADPAVTQALLPEP